jgi:transcriptional regulator with XRE-family HTH domain
MSYYSDKRRKAGLSKSEVAEQLGIEYAKYELIDRGILRMPNRFLDKFNQIVNKSKNETVIDKLDKIEVVNQWWDKVSVKKGHGHYVLNDVMKEFNIDTISELDKLLGYKSHGVVSGYLNNNKSIGFDAKNKMYNFFQDTLNIQPPKNKKQVINKRSVYTVDQQKEYTMLLEWFDSINFLEWRNKNGIENHKMQKDSGLSEGTIHNILYKKGTMKPVYATIKKFKTYYDKIENAKQQPVVMTFTSVPTNEVPEEIRKQGEELVREVNENMNLKEKLSAKYQGAIEDLEKQISMYEKKIEDCYREKEVYEQVLADLED